MRGRPRRDVFVVRAGIGAPVKLGAALFGVALLGPSSLEGVLLETGTAGPLPAARARAVVVARRHDPDVKVLRTIHSVPHSFVPSSLRSFDSTYFSDLKEAERLTSFTEREVYRYTRVVHL